MDHCDKRVTDTAVTATLSSFLYRLNITQHITQTRCREAVRMSEMPSESSYFLSHLVSESHKLPNFWFDGILNTEAFPNTFKIELKSIFYACYSVTMFFLVQEVFLELKWRL